MGDNWWIYVVVYIVMFLITVYICFLSEYKKPEETRAPDSHLVLSALIWPASYALIIITIPVYIVIRLGKKHAAKKRGLNEN